MISLRSALRRALLSYFFANRAATHYVRELAALLAVDPTNLSKELSRLEREGLFRSELRGNQRHYSLNREYPLYKEVASILLKTVGVVPTAAKALNGIAGVDAAYIYGSFAKGGQDSRSDIDLLIVGQPPAADLAMAARKLEKTFGREINYTVVSRRELKRKLAAGDPFLQDVWNGKRIELRVP